MVQAFAPCGHDEDREFSNIEPDDKGNMWEIWFCRACRAVHYIPYEGTNNA